MNDADRRDWVGNDEYLYNWWQGSGMGLWNFVRRYRTSITEHIKAMGGR